MATGGGSTPDPASPRILSAEGDEETHTVGNSPARDAQGDQQAAGNNTLNEDVEEVQTSPTVSTLGVDSSPRSQARADQTNNGPPIQIPSPTREQLRTEMENMRTGLSQFEGREAALRRAERDRILLGNPQGQGEGQGQGHQQWQWW